jgi:hypothetical protein
MRGGAGFMALAALVAMATLASCAGARPQRDPDSQIIAHLRKAGSNLAKPHHILFFLKVPPGEGASRLVSKLRELNFDANVDRFATDTLLLVVATKSLSPSDTDFVSLRKQLSALALEEKGEYEGWVAEQAARTRR